MQPVPPSTTPLGPPVVAPDAFAPGEATLRRLTVPQYQNSLRDLLGPSATLPADLEPVLALDGLVSVGASRLSLSERATEQFEAIALAATQQVFADATWRSQEIPCTPLANVDSACARKFITSFGKKAWRRPLASEEVDRWTGVADRAGTTLGDFWQGLRWAAAGILESPHFLYRVELGFPSADPKWFALNSHELASKMSYLIWNTTPDSDLLKAADEGVLGGQQGFLAQMERLLASPRARSGLSEFWSDRLRLEDLGHSPHPANVFPVVTPTLLESMQKETLTLLEDLVFTKNTDIRRFVDGKTTFLNDELATAYGLPLPGSGASLVETALPDASLRAGYLGQGSFLALNAHQTTSSPTRRGKFVRQVLLCQSIPAPPPDVNTTLATDPANPNLTTRQKLEKHRENPTCAACHALLDPIGLGFENFDAVGSFRSSENGSAIDASGSLEMVPFSTPSELSHLISGRPEFSACLAGTLFRYSAGRSAAVGEESSLQVIQAGFESSGYKFTDLVRATINNPTYFLTARPTK